MEGSRCTRRKPMCLSGRPPYPITYNRCRSHGSNSGPSDEKRVHSPLRYLDTPILIFFFKPCVIYTDLSVSAMFSEFLELNIMYQNTKSFTTRNAYLHFKTDYQNTLYYNIHSSELWVFVTCLLIVVIMMIKFSLV